MILLDTPVWVWWESHREFLSDRARTSIEGSPEVAIRPITLVELARLATSNRIPLHREVGLWLRIALARGKVEILPITLEMATRAAVLDGRYPKDPADRIIAATAIREHARLVTKDRHLLAIEELEAIW